MAARTRRAGDGGCRERSFLRAFLYMTGKNA